MKIKSIAITLLLVLATVSCVWAGPKLCLTWDPPLFYDDGTPITTDDVIYYKVYDQVGTNWVLLADVGTNIVYCTTALNGVHTFMATAIVNSFESDPSDALTVRIAKPGKPINVRR